MKDKAIEMNPQVKMLTLIAGMAAVAAAGGFLFAGHPREVGALAVLAAVSVYLAARHPEVVFVFFLTAGFYKNDPRFHLPGVDITVLFGALTMAGIAFNYWMKKEKPELPPRNMFVPYAVIAWFGALSLMYTSAPLYGMDKFTRLVTITAFSLVAPFYLFQDRKQFRNFFIAFVAIALLMLFDVWGKVNMGSAQVEDSAFGSNYLAFGFAEGVAFLVVFLYFFQADKSLLRRAAYICFLAPAIVYGLMLSGARGPLFSIVLSLAGVVMFGTRPHKYSRRVVFWTLLLAAGSVAFFFYGLESFTRMYARLDVLTEGGGSSALQRIEMAKSALRAMLRLPELFTGLGLGGFSTYYVGYDDVRGAYPHNMFLELGTEIGISGIIALGALLFLCFKRAKKTIKAASGPDYYYAVTVLAYFFFTLFNAMKSGDINDNRFLFSAVGMVYALGKVEEDEPKG